MKRGPGIRGRGSCIVRRERTVSTKSRVLCQEFADEGYVLFEGLAANKVAGVVEVDNVDIGLLGGHFANGRL